jgi:extracellular solute-binding protein (family 5)
MRRSTFIALGLATACASAEHPRTLRLGVATFGSGIDPFHDSAAMVEELAWIYADGLVGLDGVPLLASREPAVLSAGLRYRYDLRPVTFHDGTVLRADHVEAAWRALAATPRGLEPPYDAVVEVVPATRARLDVILRRHVEGFTKQFFGALSPGGVPVVREREGVPIGTGPFRIVSHSDANRWSFLRNDTSPRGRAHLDRIELHVLTSDHLSTIGALSRELDVVLPYRVRPRDVVPLRRIIRHNPDVITLVMNVEGVCADSTIRRAIVQALDAKRLHDVWPEDTLSLPVTFGPREVVGIPPRVAYDSGALLASLRHRIPNLQFTYDANSTRQSQAAVIIERIFDAAGIPLQLRPVPEAVYWSPRGPLRSGNFDIAVTTYAYPDRRPDLAADWSCALRAPRGGGFARLCDPVLERAMRAGDVRSAFSRLYALNVVVPLARGFDVIGLGPRVRAFPQLRSREPLGYSCASWDIS